MSGINYNDEYCILHNRWETYIVYLLTAFKDRHSGQRNIFYQLSVLKGRDWCFGGRLQLLSDVVLTVLLPYLEKGVCLLIFLNYPYNDPTLFLTKVVNFMIKHQMGSLNKIDDHVWHETAFFVFLKHMENDMD